MNLDTLQQFPNQTTDGNQTECVALSVADIVGNITGQLYDPDYVYACALKIMNLPPNTNGLDPYAGMLAAILYGLLPISLEDFSAKTIGELYVANWQNYAVDDRTTAQEHVMKGVKSLHSFDDITKYMTTYKAGVSLALRWYESFNSPDSNGLLKEPAGSFTYHNVAIYELTPLGLRVKPWLGSDFGDHGYVYMTPNVFEQCFEEAYAYDPATWRWFSLATMAVTRPWIIPDCLQQMRYTK